MNRIVVRISTTRQKARRQKWEREGHRSYGSNSHRKKRRQKNKKTKYEIGRKMAANYHPEKEKRLDATTPYNETP